VKKEGFMHLKQKWVVASISVAMVIFVAGLAYAGCVKPGVERWSIKTSVPEGTDLDHSKFIPLNKLLKLEDPPDVGNKDKRYQNAIVPAFSNPLNVKEGDIVTTTGWLHLVATEPDCDYHIQISDSPTDGNNCLIIEVPKDDTGYVASEKIREKAKAVREFIKDKLLNGKEPGSGNIMQHEVYVKVTGQLFYDDAHVGDAPRGKKGMKAATLWEIHPITGIDFAPTPRQ
jgi:hypothetical protein